MNTNRVVSWLLRLGIAFVFLYPPVAAHFNPDGWIWFVPDSVEKIMPKMLFLQLFGVIEILIALGVLFLKDPLYPAGAAAVILLGIIVVDWNAMDIVFRDVPILLSAIALIVLQRTPTS